MVFGVVTVARYSLFLGSSVSFRRLRSCDLRASRRAAYLMQRTSTFRSPPTAAAASIKAVNMMSVRLTGPSRVNRGLRSPPFSRPCRSVRFPRDLTMYSTPICLAKASEPLHGKVANSDPGHHSRQTCSAGKRMERPNAFRRRSGLQLAASAKVWLTTFSHFRFRSATGRVCHPCHGRHAGDAAAAAAGTSLPLWSAAMPTARSVPT